MNNFKATQTDWVNVEHSAIIHAAEACILELRARVEALEAQANHIPGATKMVPVAKVTRDKDATGNYVIVHDTATPPPVATDEELLEIWNSEKGCRPWVSRRAIYDLGVAHGQASSREVAKPAPVAGGLVERVSDVITSETGSRWASTEARAAILEQATWLREQGWKEAADLLEQEAGR
jgi:hypothetical protein